MSSDDTPVPSVEGAYTGRFAPSPTGPLHAGSMVAALASWLDARAHGGSWVVRIEDVDTERCRPEFERVILQQLADCALHADAPLLRQTERGALYAQALDRLIAAGLAYPCGCTRKDIADALARLGTPHRRGEELVYPGTCRHGLQGKPARAWRFVVPAGEGVEWLDRRLGPQRQDVAREVGDFVLRRADGPWAYQLAVVVDDAEQGISDIVRGEDLADNTARQILLQRALGLPTPRYLHTPLVRGADGEKLSKQNGAQAVRTATPAEAFATLTDAARVLGLQPPEAARDPANLLAEWVPAWKASESSPKGNPWPASYNPRP